MSSHPGMAMAAIECRWIAAANEPGSDASVAPLNRPSLSLLFLRRTFRRQML
jgi:hypothetical protein